MRFFLAVLLFAVVCGRPVPAQQPGTPGKFDFYLMNLAWSSEFCSIQGTSPGCVARPGFNLHGLWAQNDDGTYPVFCSKEPGPTDPRKNLDITPDLGLLQHEWSKHGTCSAVGPQRFFALERRAFRSLKVPHELANSSHELSMPTGQLLNLFTTANPDFPRGSILLICSAGRLTAVEACFTKELKPIACRGLDGCHQSSLTIELTPGRR